MDWRDILKETVGVTDEKDIIEFGKHNAIRTVSVSGDAFTLTVDYEDPAIAGHIAGLARKMQVHWIPAAGRSMTERLFG